MYIILEHNGGSQHNEISDDIQQMLEDMGHVVEQIVSNTDVVTLYNESREVMANFDRIPDENLLRFYVEINNE
jgi:hypothetical protein